MLPFVTSSNPAIKRNKVVFPQPDGPTKASNSPSRTVRLKSATAGMALSSRFEPGKILVTFSIVMVATGRFLKRSSRVSSSFPKVRSSAFRRSASATSQILYLTFCHDYLPFGKLMSRPVPKPGPDTRQQILQAALRRFAHSGYAGASVQHIVPEPKVTKPMLYDHF